MSVAANVASLAAAVSCLLCAALRNGKTKQRESEDTDGETNEQHGASERMIAESLKSH